MMMMVWWQGSWLTQKSWYLFQVIQLLGLIDLVRKGSQLCFKSGKTMQFGFHIAHSRMLHTKKGIGSKKRQKNKGKNKES